MHVERKLEVRSRDDCCRGKAIIITYYECALVALVIQHAKRMSRVILPSVACPAVQYTGCFTTVGHNCRR